MSRNVVITGAGSGIGKATAKQFLELGDSVFLVDVNEANLKATYDEFQKTAPGKVFMNTVNVADAKGVKALALDVEKKGGCDVLVNNAAVFRVGLLHEVPMDDYDFQFDINVRGVVNTIQSLAPQMLKKKKGAIINVSSVSGMGGDYNMSIYCATKGAVIALSRALAMDYSVHGVRVNIISPSAVETPMFLTGASDAVLDSFRKNMPNKSLCKPEWCANAIVYLASDQAMHLCGVNIPVDGGLSAWNGQPNQEKTDTGI